ncbi:MAG: hypothetical protein NE328_19130 [Lentisphaeraceae bacterium]|nr:hypothetical protein [Lentisphaeraceae bacterium]
MNWLTIANFMENKKFLEEIGIKCTLDSLQATINIDGTKVIIVDPREFNGFVMGLRVGSNMRGDHV